MGESGRELDCVCRVCGEDGGVLNLWYTRGVSPDDISAQHVTQEFERPEISLEPWFWDQQISTDETFSGALQTGDMIPKGVP